MTDWMYQAPGGLKDFRNPWNWHSNMVGQAQDIISILLQTAVPDPSSLSEAELAAAIASLAYVDPSATAVPAGAETIPVQAWNGFPRAVSAACLGTNIRQKMGTPTASIGLSNTWVTKITGPAFSLTGTAMCCTCRCETGKMSTLSGPLDGRPIKR
ncbi:phage tail protein [Chenggangzhangella methanolivorans]|uniref:Phage tail protein n=1 Tax=Chenggangzhangella methanolivorans TaxID=1437009 RepID=A0A9E6R6Y7_9HYPH|nr:phage tail protein [Chenggangzhangella methanolivorans]QZN99098.1 phage tail protein [Chenggangzhangella methanolivorans]